MKGEEYKAGSYVLYAVLPSGVNPEYPWWLAGLSPAVQKA